jgi:hypothetical protein
VTLLSLKHIPRYSEGGRQSAVSEPVGMSHDHSRLKSCLFWSYVNRVFFRPAENARARVAVQARCLPNATTTRITHSGNPPLFVLQTARSSYYMPGVSACVFSQPLSNPLSCFTLCLVYWVPLDPPGVCSTVRERQKNAVISQWRYCLSQLRV